MVCLICQKRLDQPVVMPCGCTICKSHEKNEKARNEPETISCPKCQIDHEIPEKGFVVNSIVVELLKCELDKRALETRHKVAFKSLIDLKELVDELKRFQDDPELERHRIIDELKNKIDLQREKEKQKIDDEALKLIEELDEYEKTCKTSSLENIVNPIVLSEETIDIIKSLEGKIKEWEDDLKKFSRNLKGWKFIHDETVSKYQYLYKERQRIRPTLYTDELLRLQHRQKAFCEKIFDPIM